MAQSTSHQDASRSKVGKTAHLVASLRGVEHNRVDSLFKDPYGELLGNNFGNGEQSNVAPDDVKTDIDAAVTIDPLKVIPQGLIALVAIRTRKIDDEAKNFVRNVGKGQICVLGAGLDTRPWRLDLSDEVDASAAVDTSSINYFELDFPEIFQYKLPVLENAGAASKFNYVSVQADLSLPGWTEKLTAAGFDRAVPTFWLLEGFTGYLTEAEFHALFDTLTELSAPRSRLVATFLTPETKTKTSMHRFTPEVPVNEVTRHAGWTGVQEDIKATGVHYSRTIDDHSMDGYYFVLADYQV